MQPQKTKRCPRCDVEFHPVGNLSFGKPKWILRLVNLHFIFGLPIILIAVFSFGYFVSDLPDLGRGSDSLPLFFFFSIVVPTILLLITKSAIRPVCRISCHKCDYSDEIHCSPLEMRKWKEPQNPKGELQYETQDPPAELRQPCVKEVSFRLK